MVLADVDYFKCGILVFMNKKKVKRKKRQKEKKLQIYNQIRPETNVN